MRDRAPPTPNYVLRDRIRQARLAAGMTKAELARRVGVCVSAAVQWEHPDGTSPTIKHLARIASIVGVAFEWLATGRGPTHVEPASASRHAVAASTFEERLLDVARRVPSERREPMIALVAEWARAPTT
jgi:transcriptional regulator with XRE-family HTH domain